MDLLNNLRYYMTNMALTAPSFMKFWKTAAKFHIGHDKIIGWEKGLPVRSLILPAEYSSPFIKLTARLYNSLRQDIQNPGIASLSITTKCDCSCSHCYAYGLRGEELSTDKWIEVIKESLDLGVFTFLFTGGEPLLREDLPELINAVDKESAICLIYTNGSQLKERAKELYKAGLRRIFVSIDYPDETEHDKHRGQKGLMKNALEGLEEARRLGMLVGFSTFVSPERLHSNILENIFNLGIKHKVNEIAVFDALPTGRLENRLDLKLTTKQYKAELQSFIKSWWSKKGAPGIWWRGYVESFQSCGCAGGTTMFNVSPSGEFCPCDFCHQSIGSVNNTDLQTLWIRLNAMAKIQRSKGAKCWLLQNDEECSFMTKNDSIYTQARRENAYA